MIDFNKKDFQLTATSTTTFLRVVRDMVVCHHSLIPLRIRDFEMRMKCLLVE